MRRRRPWPQAAARYRDDTEEAASAHGDLLRETLVKIRDLRSARATDEELVRALTDIERDVLMAALALSDIRAWMDEASRAELGPGEVEEGPT